MQEIWKDVVGFDGMYQISDHGRLRSLDRYVRTKGDGMRMSRGKLISPTKRKDGYIHFMLCDAQAKRVTLFAHRMVVEAFIGLKEGYDVNHKDCNRSNNHVSNLECVSRRENIHHSKYLNGNKFIGVYYNKNVKKYIASICIQGKSIDIGSFQTREEASKSYKLKLLEIGEMTKYV